MHLLPSKHHQHTLNTLSISVLHFMNFENVHMRCFRYSGATCSMPYLAGSGPSSLEISSQECWFILCSKMLGLPYCWGPCSLLEPRMPCCWGPSSLHDAGDHGPAQHLPPRSCCWTSHPWRATHPYLICITVAPALGRGGEGGAGRRQATDVVPAPLGLRW